MNAPTSQTAVIVPRSIAPGARTLGIDVGNMGAFAILAGGELVAVHDMPCLADGPARRRSINAPLLAALIREAGASKAYVEFISARPGDGPTGAFAFGRARARKRSDDGRRKLICSPARKDDGRAEAALIGLAGVMREATL
jgi:hypothetical protein